MEVNITNNSLILNTLSFKTLGCDELITDKLTIPTPLGDIDGVTEFKKLRNIAITDGGATFEGIGAITRARFTNLDGTIRTQTQPDIRTIGTSGQNLRLNGNVLGMTVTDAMVLTAPIQSMPVLTTTRGSVIFGGGNMTIQRYFGSGGALIDPTLTLDGTTSSVDAAFVNLSGGANIPELYSSIRLNDNRLSLGAHSNDQDVLRTSGKGGIIANFAGVTNLNGVVLYGAAGGILGGNLLGVTTSERCALRWWASGLNASVGINTTATPDGALDVNGSARIRGRIQAAGGIVNADTLPQGFHVAWNYQVGQGETALINKSGAGGGGFHFYNSSGDGSAFSTGQTTLAHINGEGINVFSQYLRGRPVMCHVRTSTTGIWSTTNNLMSLFTSSAGGTFIEQDWRPASMNVGGMTNGAYRVPVAGVWRLRVKVRAADGAGARGIFLRRWDGTTAHIIDAFAGNDGAWWIPIDTDNRRCLEVSALVTCAAFNELYVTSVLGGTTNWAWAVMTVEYLGPA